MAKPSICIFNLSKAKEFPRGAEQVAKWIVNKSRTEGEYLFRKARPLDLPLGSTVIFSVENKIIGEGIVKESAVPTPSNVRNYRYRMLFKPSTLMVYDAFPNKHQVTQETGLAFGRLFTYVRKKEQYRAILKLARATTREIHEALGSAIRVYVESPSHLEREVEDARRRITSKSTAKKIDLDIELRKVTFENLPERIQYPGLVRVQRSIDMLASIDVKKTSVSGQVLYLCSKTRIDRINVSLVKEFRALIYDILNVMTYPEFASNAFGISYEESDRDAHRFKNLVLFNVNHYSKNKSRFYWLFTCAREVAYLINGRRDQRHMKIMRELAVRALEKLAEEAR
jgi:hypothetical protein